MCIAGDRDLFLSGSTRKDCWCYISGMSPWKKGRFCTNVGVRVRTPLFHRSSSAVGGMRKLASDWIASVLCVYEPFSFAGFSGAD
ncbi:hypothetical protein J6590_097345 [Homalodisca vitripennis]|nr:hypothetical protein J6590_097345 [Homalodisca vitripennis]